MRRVVIALLILTVPSVTAVVVFLILNKKIPTNPQAIGRVSIIAGTGSPGADDGPANAAAFGDPFGVAIDRKGNLYVTDSGNNNRIRKLDTDGKVETIAGSDEGYSEGFARQAQFNTPSGIAIDRSGNIIIADTSNNRIRKVGSDGKVSTLAGNGRAGLKEGRGEAAEFDGPIGLAVDKQGNTFVADSYNDCIRKISPDGVVATIGGIGIPGFADGDSNISQFDTPSGIAVDETGNVFVADTGNSAVRRIDSQGHVTTLFRNDGAEGSVHLNHPVGLVVTHDGFVFVTHTRGIVRIDPNGSASIYAGGREGFEDGVPGRFNGPAGIALDRHGNLFVADSHNFLIRQIAPIDRSYEPAGPVQQAFIQPATELPDSDSGPRFPKVDVARMVGPSGKFPWPLAPQNESHEVTGVMGEARGAAGGVALDHLHSGLDVRGEQGESVLSVFDEKVSGPISNWDFGGGGEGIQIGLMSYIHTRIGRNIRDQIQIPEKVKAVNGTDGKPVRVRVRRGTRFKVGDFIGSINRQYHVHLNLGPWNAQTNPLILPINDLKDTVPPTIEPNGIEILKLDGTPFTQKTNGRVVVSGDIRIFLRAFDRVDGNAPRRKLGLYRAGYQLLRANGVPVAGYEQPLVNIEFDRLPADDQNVTKVYATGSGVSAYGTPTEFRYILTNRVSHGDAMEGFLRTSMLDPGAYILRVLAEDYAGNRASGPSTEVALEVTR